MVLTLVSDRSARRREHDDWITSYLAAVVPKSEAPERFHFWIGASIIAGALRRRVSINMEAFSWFPNMFIVLVGPPGTVKKSTSINVGARLLRDVPNIHFGSDITTWEGFIQQVENAEDIFAEGDPQPRLDFNEEYKVTSALTCIVSEWGTFLDPDNYNMINMLTELYDGKSDIPLRKTTKTHGDNIIVNPFLNMIAGTTPSWMADNFKGRFGGWGFSSRCIFLHASQPERLIPYPDEEWQGTFQSQMQSFTKDLIEISRMKGQYVLDPAARNYGRDWYRQHMERKVRLDEHPDHNPWLSYYLARKFDHAHKLAMVIAASQGSQLLITYDHLKTACDRCDEVEVELSKVFGSNVQDTSRAVRLNQSLWVELENMITKNGGGFEERGIYAWTLRRLTYGESKAFIEHLIAGNWLKKEVNNDGTWLVFGSAYKNATEPTRSSPD